LTVRLGLVFKIVETSPLPEVVPNKNCCKTSFLFGKVENIKTET
jgi:hypothetical protein